MAPRSMRSGVQSWKLSNVGQSLDGGPKIYYHELPPCFERHVKPLVPAAFAVVSTHQRALGPRGWLWPLCVPNPKNLTADVTYWWEYSPITQEVAGSIPAQCKHLCACLFVLGLVVSMYNMYVFTKKVYKYVFIRYLESLTQAV
jgi:hypothetical protein